MLSMTDLFGLYLDSTGLAEASMAVLEFSWQTIPAFATEIVYYSMALKG